MPSRWFVPVPGLSPDRVRRHFVHAAVSSWFDRSGLEHLANDKPYTVSNLVCYGGEFGLVVTTLTDLAENALRHATRPGAQLRLGSQVRRLGAATLLHQHSWEALQRTEPAGRWTIELLSPTTFRTGDRSSPLPAVPTMLGGLVRCWDEWSGLPATGLDPATPALWVSDLDLRSEVVAVTINARHGGTRDIHLSCALGAVTIRCDDPGTAAAAAPLLRLAPYAGIGAMRGKGFGMVRVHAESRAQGRPAGAVEAADGAAG